MFLCYFWNPDLISLMSSYISFTFEVLLEHMYINGRTVHISTVLHVVLIH